MYSDDEMSGEDGASEQQGGAFGQLMASLPVSSQYLDLYKKRRRQQEGEEESDGDSEQEREGGDDSDREEEDDDDEQDDEDEQEQQEAAEQPVKAIDPFSSHLGRVLEHEAIDALKAVKKASLLQPCAEWTVDVLRGGSSDSSSSSKKKKKKRAKTHVLHAFRDQNSNALPPRLPSLEAYGVPGALAARWRKVHKVQIQEMQQQAKKQQQQQQQQSSSVVTKKGKRKKAKVSAAAVGAGASEAASLAPSCAGMPSRLQDSLFPVINDYRDTWFPNRTPGNGAALRRLYLLHVLNHVLKTRALIHKHDAELKALEPEEEDGDEERLLGGKGKGKGGKPLPMNKKARKKEQQRLRKLAKLKQARAEARLRERQEAGEGGGSQGEGSGDEEEAGSSEAAPAASAGKPAAGGSTATLLGAAGEQVERKDRGFTRPSVLILVPTRNSCHEIVNEILRLLPKGNKRSIQNRKRFNSEYGIPEGAPSHEDKPADYQEAFKGNSDDCFKFGLALGAQNVKLYSDFYASDIVVASPLGLRLRVGTDGDKGEDRDSDFLSSVEVCVVDQGEVLGMQNWEHVKTVLESMNKIPYKSHDTDFSRVRDWYLNDWAGLYRQTLVFSAYETMDMKQLFKRHCKSHAGRVCVRPKHSGVLSKVVTDVRQIFQRVSCEKLSQLSDARFTYFMEEVVPKIKASVDGHTLIYVPSFFDFVRVRNAFKKKRYKFALASEYTKNKELSRGRSAFFHGNVDFLILTDRFNFYRRYKIRGMRHVVFYSPPENPKFYSEFLNFMEKEAMGDNTCLALYTRYDALELERIVGSERAGKILASDRLTHMFC